MFTFVVTLMWYNILWLACDVYETLKKELTRYIIDSEVYIVAIWCGTDKSLLTTYT